MVHLISTIFPLIILTLWVRFSDKDFYSFYSKTISDYNILFLSIFLNIFASHWESQTGDHQHTAWLLKNMVGVENEKFLSLHIYPTIILLYAYKVIKNMAIDYRIVYFLTYISLLLSDILISFFAFYTTYGMQAALHNIHGVGGGLFLDGIVLIPAIAPLLIYIVKIYWKYVNKVV